MTDYEKIEWIHSQISELRDGVEVDLKTMQNFIEDIREKFINGESMKKCEYCFEQHGEIVWNIGFINNEWLCLECGDKVENKEEKA